MIIFVENLILANQYKKISIDLLGYAFFSGIVLGILVSIPIFLIGMTNQAIYFFFILLFIYPIISTWIYRNRVSFLDFRSAFSVSFLTLLIASFIYCVFMHFKAFRPFDFSQFVFSLPPLIAYSFLLATFLKK